MIDKLQQVDKARMKEQSQLLASAEQVSNTKTVTIDTSSKQVGACPLCFAEMELKELRRHMAQNCSSADMTCPEFGCGATFPAYTLKKHLTKECAVAKKRNALTLQATMRKEERRLELLKNLPAPEDENASYSASFLEALTVAVSTPAPSSSSPPRAASPPSPRPDPEALFKVCLSCNESMPGSKMQHHLARECRMRLIYCPNRVFGLCEKEVCFNDLQEHLRSDCATEKRKDEMISRIALRRVPVRCSACGLELPLNELRKHEVESCKNRKVPCRNAHLGCTVMVRAWQRKRHEEVDGKAKTRYCLFLAGGGSHLALGEDDVPCPWTSEFWLYRTSAREASKQYIRSAVVLCALFVDAFFVEHAAKAWADKLTASLKTSPNSKPVSLEDREETMRRLADAVEVMEDACLASIAASMQVGCAIGAAQGAMQEFLGPLGKLAMVKPAQAKKTQDTEKNEVRTEHSISGGGRGVEMELVFLKGIAPGRSDEIIYATVSRTGSKSGTRQRSKSSREKSASSSSETGEKIENEEEEEAANEHEFDDADAVDEDQGQDEAKNGNSSRSGTQQGVEDSSTLPASSLSIRRPTSSTVPASTPSSAIEASVLPSSQLSSKPGSSSNAKDVPSATSSRPSSSSSSSSSFASSKLEEGGVPSSETDVVAAAAGEAASFHEATPAWQEPQGGEGKSSIGELLLITGIVKPPAMSAGGAAAAAGADVPPTPPTPVFSSSTRAFDASTKPKCVTLLEKALKRGKRTPAGVGVLQSSTLLMRLPWKEWWLATEILAGCLDRDNFTLRRLREASGLLEDPGWFGLQ